MSCLYDAGPGETRNKALKRNFRSLQEDHDQLDELIHLMQTRSEVEAIAILKHLRSLSDTSAALNMIKAGDLLVQASKQARTRVELDSGKPVAPHCSSPQKVSANPADMGEISPSQSEASPVVVSSQPDQVLSPLAHIRSPDEVNQSSHFHLRARQP